MSLNDAFPVEIPSTTKEIVEVILSKDSVCRLLGEEGEKLVDEAELSLMYAREGRGGINPVLLSFVLILQYLEGIPDRQASLMSVMRMDWKYALRQELTWAGFNYSSLCNFRKRLYQHGQEFIIFEQLITYLKEQGHIKGQKQRTDATHILGAIEKLSRLELVLETMRLALGAVINADARWMLDKLPVSFVETYTQKREDYRLTKKEQDKMMQQAGEDGLWFLSHLKHHGHKKLHRLAEVKLLERVLSEQFETGEADDKRLTSRSDRTACGDVIASPHDVDVRYSKKGKQTKWEGYKAQITETVDPDLPLITDIAIHCAIEPDCIALDEIQERLSQRDLKPNEQYVDQGYCNSKTIASSLDQHIDLRGYVQNDSHKAEGFRLQDFEIDFDTRTATCPQGRVATSFTSSSQENVAFHIRFGKQCLQCPVKEHCTSEKRGRSLEIGTHYPILAQRRLEQKNKSFQTEMNRRARIESTISELTNKHRLRRSRYRGGTTKAQSTSCFYRFCS